MFHIFEIMMIGIKMECAFFIWCEQECAISHSNGLSGGISAHAPFFTLIENTDEQEYVRRHVCV